MKRRILSLILAIAMCFTAVSTAVIAAETSDPSEVLELYAKRIWDWQEGQFEAMTDEQKDVIANAYANFDADVIRALAAEKAELILAGNTVFFETETMKDLYMWKLMRDMMEGRVDVQLDSAEFDAWFDEFTAFEEANDEAVSAQRPIAALNGLKSYSSDLTVFFGRLMTIYNAGAAVSGADAEKFEIYAAAFNAQENGEGEVPAEYAETLEADVIELIADGTVDAFELAIQVACFKKVRGDEIFEELADRTMKSAFLLFGEDFVRYVVDFVTTSRDKFISMDKKPILAQVAGSDGLAVMGANNQLSYDAMYNVSKAVSEYVEGQDFMSELMGMLKDDFGFDADAVANAREVIADGVKEAMATLDENHGVELVHFDAYVGRAILVPGMNSVIEIEVGTKGVIDLSFEHSRYAFVGETLKNFSLEQFEVAYEGECGITAALGEQIGVIELDATAEGIKKGDTITLYLYRGYDDEEGADAQDAYRYVTTYTVKAVSDAEEPFVDLEEVKDPVVDEDGNTTVEVKGETNLDEVKVVVKDEEGNVVYEGTHTKEELEAGIDAVVPGVEAGDKLTVEVTEPGSDEVLDSDEVTVVDGPYVDLEEVKDPVVEEDGNTTVEVKGETNLDEVDVVIKDEDGNVVYEGTHTKEELEAGIDAVVPGVEVGDKLTVEVTEPGKDEVLDSDEVTVVDGPYVRLEDVLDTTVDGEIVIKGSTNLDYVTVAIVKNGETIYAVVYDKATFKEGVTLQAPADAEIGDVYTVVVGTEKAADSDDFTIIGADEIYEVTLEDVLDTTVDGEIVIKGTTTNIDYVTVSIIKNGETIYAVVYDKATFENGITLQAPANAEIGDVYTVVVGTEKAADSDDFTIIGKYVNLDELEDPAIDEDGKVTVVVKGETNLDEVKVVIKDEEGNVVYEGTHTKEELEAGINAVIPEGVEVGDKLTVEVTEPGSDEVLDSDEVTVKDTPYVDLEEVEDPTLDKDGKVTVVVKGETNLDEVKVVIKDEEGNVVYEGTHTKEELEAGINAVIPEGVEAGDKLTVEVTQPGKDKVLDSDEVTVKDTLKPVLKLAGDTDGDGVSDRTVTKGSTITITTTPQNVPEGSTAEVIWTIVNAAGEVEQVKVSGDANNILTIKGITVGKGVVVTGTLYVDGVATDATVTINVTVKKKSSGGGGGGTITVPDDKPTVHTCEWPDIAVGWEGNAAAHWAHLTIDQMTINGYIKGYPDGLFRPDQNITRAEFTAIVYRILGLQEAEDGVLYDDTVGHWAEGIIATMSLPEGYGMTRGYGDGNFGPNDNITREQAVAIIARAKSAVWVAAEEGAKDVFTDAEDISWWFDGEMDAAVTNGLITGYEDGSYRPLNFTTRAEACTLLARAWPEVLE